VKGSIFQHYPKFSSQEIPLAPHIMSSLPYWLCLSPSDRHDFLQLSGLTQGLHTYFNPTRYAYGKEGELCIMKSSSNHTSVQIDNTPIEDVANIGDCANDAYSIFAQRQRKHHNLYLLNETRLNDNWFGSRLRELPNELRHMIYQNVLLEPQAFDIMKAKLEGPFAILCETYPEIGAEISRGALNGKANAKNRVYNLPWRPGHFLIPKMTEFHFAARAVEVNDRLCPYQLDQYELAIWDSFISSSPLVEIIRHCNVEIEFPHLKANASTGSFPSYEHIYRAIDPLLHGLRFMSSISRCTINIIIPNLASLVDSNNHLLDLSFTIWDMFWTKIAEHYRHPGYVSLCYEPHPEVRLVVTDSSDGTVSLDEVLPGTNAMVDPEQYPWYDTDYFEDSSLLR